MIGIDVNVLAACMAVLCLAACAPKTQCTLTGAFDVRVGAPIPTSSPWLADVPSCGDQMDLPLGTIISFGTPRLDDNCEGTASVNADQLRG